MHYQQRNDLKTIVQIVFWISFLLLVVASTSVFALEAPSSITEGDLLTVTWTQSQGTSYSLERGGVQVDTTNPYEWQTQSGDAGSYIFSLYENGSFVEATTVQIQENEIDFSVIQPSSDTYTTNTINIQLETQSDVDFCYYVLESESNTLSENNNVHTGSFTREDGIYTLELKCKDGSKITEKEKTILIDSTAPEITDKEPSNTISGDKATVSVTTDEVASCTYVFEGEANTQALTTSDKLVHTAIVTRPGQNVLEVTCKDAHGNEVTQNLEYTLETPPSASIEIENSAEYEVDGTIILTAGSYPITLTASEEILEPSLSYAFQGGGRNSIALSKESEDSTIWEGFLSIPTSAGEKAASFELELETPEGVRGTKITQGKLFLVDTIIPEEVQNPKAERIKQKDQSYIRLSWSDTQDVEYNIYRSTIDRVSDGDYLAQTSANYYEDRNVGSEKYYYVIAAEDKAGNIGTPSRIITPSGTIQELSSDSEENSQLQGLEEKLKKAIIDLETAKKSLETERNEEKLLLIREANLLEEITTLLSELQSYEGDLAQNKENIDAAIPRVNKILPTRIEIDAQIDFEQDPSLQAQNEVLAQTARFFGQEASVLESTRQRSEFQTRTQQLNDETRIASKILAATVTFADRSTQGYTYVSRQITVPISTQTIKIIEKPFTNIEDMQTSISKNGDFLETEILSGESTTEYSYLVQESFDLATARTARAVAVPGLPSAESTNSITGQAFNTQLTDFSWTYLVGIIMIAGLTVYYFMTPAGPSSVDQLTNALTQVLQKQNLPSTPRKYFSSSPQQFYKRRKPEFTSRPSQVFPSRQSPQSFFERRNLKKTASSSPSLSEKIQTAHAHIDQKEYIPARNIYQEAIEKLSGVSEQEKESVNELYYKIMLYQTVQRAVESAEQKDAQKLQDQLSVLQGIAQKVPESQTTLITDAKAVYAELNKKANRLVIEQENL